MSHQQCFRRGSPTTPDRRAGTSVFPASLDLGTKQAQNFGTSVFPNWALGRVRHFGVSGMLGTYVFPSKVKARDVRCHDWASGKLHMQNVSGTSRVSGPGKTPSPNPSGTPRVSRSTPFPLLSGTQVFPDRARDRMVSSGPRQPSSTTGVSGKKS